LASCNNDDIPTETTSSTQTTSITTEPITVTTETTTEGKRIEGILLASPERFEQRGGPHEKRMAYYYVNGFVLNLVTKDEEIDWLTKYFYKDDGSNIPDDEVKESFNVSFVKYFNIPKEDFVKAINKAKEFCREHNMDITTEEYELPNPDIIYTFDNEIIDHYYRRE
jgi:hypothetical protein